MELFIYQPEVHVVKARTAMVNTTSQEPRRGNRCKLKTLNDLFSLANVGTRLPAPSPSQLICGNALLLLTAATTPPRAREGTNSVKREISSRRRKSRKSLESCWEYG